MESKPYFVVTDHMTFAGGKTTSNITVVATDPTIVADMIEVDYLRSVGKLTDEEKAIAEDVWKFTGTPPHEYDAELQVDQVPSWDDVHQLLIADGILPQFTPAMKEAIEAEGMVMTLPYWILSGGLQNPTDDDNTYDGY